MIADSMIWLPSTFLWQGAGDMGEGFSLWGGRAVPVGSIEEDQALEIYRVSLLFPFSYGIYLQATGEMNPGCGDAFFVWFSFISLFPMGVCFSFLSGVIFSPLFLFFCMRPGVGRRCDGAALPHTPVYMKAPPLPPPSICGA